MTIRAGETFDRHTQLLHPPQTRQEMDAHFVAARRAALLANLAAGMAQVEPKTPAEQTPHDADDGETIVRGRE